MYVKVRERQSNDIFETQWLIAVISESEASMKQLRRSAGKFVPMYLLFGGNDINVAWHDVAPSAVSLRTLNRNL